VNANRNLNDKIDVTIVSPFHRDRKEKSVNSENRPLYVIIVWFPNGFTKITYEQHPYDDGEDVPEWHKGPHWHLDTPKDDHERYLPGDPIPGYCDK
jgi:hypothetical protein